MGGSRLLPLNCSPIKILRRLLDTKKKSRKAHLNSKIFRSKNIPVHRNNQEFQPSVAQTKCNGEELHSFDMQMLLSEYPSMNQVKKPEDGDSLLLTTAVTEDENQQAIRKILEERNLSSTEQHDEQENNVVETTTQKKRRDKAQHFLDFSHMEGGDIMDLAANEEDQ